VDWITFAKEAGAYISPLLMGAVIWLNADRNRLLESLGKKDVLLSEKDEKLQSLSERTLVAMTEIKTFLFNAGHRA
jgi:shikimate kinase